MWSEFKGAVKETFTIRVNVKGVNGGKRTDFQDKNEIKGDLKGAVGIIFKIKVNEEAQ